MAHLFCCKDCGLYVLALCFFPTLFQRYFATLPMLLWPNAVPTLSQRCFQRCPNAVPTLLWPNAGPLCQRCCQRCSNAALTPAARFPRIREKNQTFFVFLIPVKKSEPYIIIYASHSPLSSSLHPSSSLSLSLSLFLPLHIYVL